MTRQGGFTVLETMVAVLVLAVGILAIAASSGVVTRLIAQGQLDSEVSALGHQRLETLRSLPCDSMVGGVDEAGVFYLSWTTMPTQNGRAMHVALIVVSPSLVGSTKRTVFSTAMICR